MIATIRRRTEAEEGRIDPAFAEVCAGFVNCNCPVCGGKLTKERTTRSGRREMACRHGHWCDPKKAAPSLQQLRAIRCHGRRLRNAETKATNPQPTAYAPRIYLESDLISDRSMFDTQPTDIGTTYGT